MGRGDKIIVLSSNKQAGDEGLTDVLERVNVIDLEISLRERAGGEEGGGGRSA
jgi:hypothetical protein